MAQTVKNLPVMQETWVQSLHQECPLEEGIPTPVFLPREFHGQRSLVGYRPQGHKGSVMNERLTHTYKTQRKTYCSNRCVFTLMNIIVMKLKTLKHF